jgi:GPH family glycoside/pentoside/hexuronide:cation symporter
MRNPNAQQTEKRMTGRPYTAPNRQIWAWGVGALANHILICTYGQATAIFTIGFSLNAALVSWAIMLPRLIDGITDPILGHISDNTHTRWGRRKPFLVIGSILASLFLMALWWADPSWSPTAQLSYLFVVGTLFYCSWGLYSMSWNAIGYELTDDYHERSKVSAVGSFFLGIILLGNAWIYWFALRPLFEHGVFATFNDFVSAGWSWENFTAVFRRSFLTTPGAPTNEINGIRWIAALAGGIAILAALTTVLVCKERFSKANAKRKHVPMLEAIRATMRNKPFLNLVLMKMCQTLGERAGGGILVFVGVYYVCQGDKSLAFQITGIGSTVGTVWGFAMLPLIKPISRWIGKKGGIILGASGSLVAAIITPFAYSPSQPYLMLLPALLTITLISISNTISQAVMPDICDVDELETGHRREGLFTAVLGFVQKIEISLCALLVGYLVVWSGLDTKIASQPPEVLQRLFWLAVLPNIFFTAGYFLIALRFPLTEATMNDVRATLDRRHQEKGISTESH